MPRTADADLAEAVERLIRKARHWWESSPSCKRRPRTLRVANVRVLPWSFSADVYKHDGIEHWCFSAKLIGRSATDADWRRLGQMLARMVVATGYPTSQGMPEGPPIAPSGAQPVTYRWMWHSDGSDMDPELLEWLRALWVKELN
jgi:hypothetical protein